MKLLPRDSFTIHTALSPEAVAATLETWVEPKQWLRFGRGEKAFEGEYSSRGFKISRIINYRNSFIPVVRGTFRPGPRGVTIAVTMTLHLFVWIFLGIWLGFLTLVGALFVASVPGGKSHFDTPMLIPLGMVAFGLALMNIPFWIEAARARTLLQDMFGAPISR